MVVRPRSTWLFALALLPAAACSDGQSGDGGSGSIGGGGIGAGGEGADAAPADAGSDAVATAAEDAGPGVAPDVPPDVPPDVMPDVMDTGPDVIAGPLLRIYVEGSLEDKAPADGLSAQTPEPYAYGLQRLEMLRSADDPAPETIFDYGAEHVMVDMHASNLVAEVPASDLPDDVFTHFRITVPLLKATVAGTLHEVPTLGTWSTDLDITYALADLDTEELGAMDQGDARVSLEVFGNPMTFPFHWPVAYPLPAPDAWAEAVDGTTLVTFALSPPLTVSSFAGADVAYRITYFVHDSFRWQDEDEEGYVEAVWDIKASSPQTFEPVLWFGSNAYAVSMD